MKNLLHTAVCLLATAFAPAVAQDDCEFEAGMYIVTGAQSGRSAQTAIVVR